LAALKPVGIECLQVLLPNLVCVCFLARVLKQFATICSTEKHFLFTANLSFPSLVDFAGN